MFEDYLLLLLAFALGSIITGAIAWALHNKHISESETQQALRNDHMLYQVNHALGQMDQTSQTVLAAIQVLDRTLDRISEFQPKLLSTGGNNDRDVVSH